jgi:16S rRNA (cytidine1402-2'-O)-methyltransferase
MKGSFFVVATPIGNLGDMTYRAVQTLKDSHLILCENAKNSRKLLEHYEIKTPYESLHRVREKQDHLWIANILEGGNHISYISDAGTPGVSDPGSSLVRYLRQNGHDVVPIPGPSALSAILSISGAQVNPTSFLGFLSEKSSRKERELELYASQDSLIVFFESVHKILGTLEIARRVFPHAEILIGRELTKLHEEVILWSPGTDLPKFEKKGEFVVLINNHLKKIAKEGHSLTDN